MSIEIKPNNYKLTLASWLKKKELNEGEYDKWLKVIEVLDEETVSQIHDYLLNHPEELDYLTDKLR